MTLYAVEVYSDYGILQGPGSSEFTLAADSGTQTTISTGDILSVLGGTGIDTVTSPDTVTVSIDSTVVTKDDAQTLTNKRIRLAAGATGADTAPLKFASGALNTAPEVGAIEFLTDKWYATITTGANRKEFALVDPIGGLQSGRIPYATTNGRLTDAAGFTSDGSTITIASANIDGGTIDGTIIGGSSVAAGSFTALTAQTLTVTPTADAIAVAKVTNLANNSNVLVVDTTNQRIGVNMAAGLTLAAKLHVGYGDLRFESITPPGAATVALAGTPGNIDNGTHLYRVTFVNASGETQLGTVSSSINVTDKTVNGQVSLTAIPIATAGLQVTSRKIYRTKAGAAAYFLLTTIADNTTATYTDNTADASLGATDCSLQTNSTAASIFLNNSRAARLGADNTSSGIASFGFNALANLTAASFASAFGHRALQALTSGFGNSAFGALAGNAITIGVHNTLVGIQAGLSLVTASNSTMVGMNSGFNATGSNNTMVGSSSGSAPNNNFANTTTTGYNNTFLGTQTGQASSTQRNNLTCVGYRSVGDADNLVVLGGTGSEAVDVAIARTTASTRLHVTKVDTGTNTVVNVETINHNSSGGIATNFGVATLWTGQSSTSPDVEFGRLRWFWTTATHASRKGRGVLSAYDTAERDCLAWEASGTAPMLAFFGTAPIIQPINTTALDTLVTNIGLRASGGEANFANSVVIETVGKGIKIKEGSNATMGRATLSLGTVTVSTDKVTNVSEILLGVQEGGTYTGSIKVSARINGTSFTLLSVGGPTDTAVVSWLILEPAP